MSIQRHIEVSAQSPDEGWCEACEDDEHEDGTPPEVRLLVGPIFNHKTLVLCRGCALRLCKTLAMQCRVIVTGA